MENHPKRRKLMTSRSGACSSVVVGSGVLINGGGGGVGGVGGGGGVGGVARGGGAMAAVRGRTLPRTGGQAPGGNSIAKQSTQRQTFKVPGALAARARLRKERDHEDDKENAVTRGCRPGVGLGSGPGAGSRPAKRERDKEGDAIDAATTGALHTAVEHDQPGVGATVLRMAKNAGESRIPLPGAVRPSLLPKPKVFTHPKIAVLRKPSTLAMRAKAVNPYDDTPTTSNKNSGPITSTPSDKLVEMRISTSPVDSVGHEDVGKVVCVGGEKTGILKYYGALEGELGAWCGIELHRPEGLNDGSVRGLKYFNCAANHGIMAPANKVRRLHTEDSNTAQQGHGFGILRIPEHTECQFNRLSMQNNTFVTGHGPNASLRTPNPACSGVIANSTFLLESNARPDATFDLVGGTFHIGKISPDTSFVATDHSEAKVVTEEKTTNETRIIDDKNNKNCALNVESNKIQEETEPKTTSAMLQTKVLKGSRLIPPTKLVKSSGLTTKIISPTKTVDAKMTNPEMKLDTGITRSSQNSTFVTSPAHGTFIMENGVPSTNNIVPASRVISSQMDETCMAKEQNNQFVVNSPLESTFSKSNDDVNVSHNTKESDHRPENYTVTVAEKISKYSPEKSKFTDIAEVVNKKPVADSIANLALAPKPTGAVFALNETFINEKPRNEVTAPTLAPISYTTKSPVVETPFAKKSIYLCGKDTISDKVSVENKAFDLANAMVAKKPVINLLRAVAMKDNMSILSENEMDNTFLIERNSSLVKPLNKNSDVLDGILPIDKNSTYEENIPIDKNISFRTDDNRKATIRIEDALKKKNEYKNPFDIIFPKSKDKKNIFEEDLIDINDTFFTSPSSRFSIINNGSINIADPSLSSTFRESIGLPSAFEDSKLSQIDAMTNSCLIDATSGPYSLLGISGVEEDDELTPPAAPPPSKATPAPHYLMLNKQNSFEHDESLGILTPDQMTEFTMALECSRTPSCENLTGSGGSRIAMTRASASRPSDLPTSVDGEPTEGSSERTPSPEELPLDPKPTEPARTVPVSFITSVTSITSLEAGYQGDGENSRPASRGADPPPVAPPPNLPAPRPDPMTDSDFFTESDADAHEEIVRGDRRAQVIDGTLFCAPGGRRCPSFTGEEMDSSGIYSDLDRRQDEPPHEEVQSEEQTPDTADTVSQKSQPSPNKTELAPVIMDCLQVPLNTLDSSVDSNTSVATMEITVIEAGNENSPPKALNKTEPAPLKKYKMPKRNVVSKIKAMIESGPKDEAEKEGRRPQRNPRKGGRWDAVMSKIEAGKNEQRTRPPRKEVKSRVLQSLGTPLPAAPRRSAGDTPKSKNRRTRGRQDVTSPTQETAHSSVHSSMSDLSSAPRSTKKRLGSPGGSEGSAHSTPRISSPRQQQPPSSLTIANNNAAVTVAATNNNNTSNTNSINHNQPRVAAHSQRSPTAANPPRRTVNGRGNQQTRQPNNSEAKKNALDVSRVNLEKSPSVARKPAVPRRSPSNVTPKQQTAPPPKDRGAKENTPVTRGPVDTRDQADQTIPTHEARHLKHAEASVQALSVIVQYLAHQLDGFSAPKLKKDCERMKTEWMEARLEAEELRAGHRRIEEELRDQRDEHQGALDQLRSNLETSYAERLTELETTLEEERQKFEARLDESLNETIREHQGTVARLRAEHEADLIRKEAETDRRSVVHDQGAALRAEAESLRTVLELRSQEITLLRAENDNLRREVEGKEALEQKVEALEARCEDLRAQLQRKETFERQLSHENKVLLESFHQENKQNKRLSQHNEELQWRLRQNNEVVTVLANQLATPPQRLSRSLGPEHINHTHSPDDSPPASPMVKSMVEKSDSVSWTLEIEESPEAVASRLLRRSGSTRGISPSDSRPKRPRQPSSTPGAATVSRQSSLRTTPQRAVVLRARSKSVSVADNVPKEAWAPGFSSTPSAVRRRPRSDPAASPVVAVEPSSGARPQEAGGEAMISEETSASSSEDESSASSDIPRLAMELSWSESEG